MKFNAKRDGLQKKKKKLMAALSGSLYLNIAQSSRRVILSKI